MAKHERSDTERQDRDEVRALLETVQAQLRRAEHAPTGADGSWRAGVTYARISVEDALHRLRPVDDVADVDDVVPARGRHLHLTRKAA